MTTNRDTDDSEGPPGGRDPRQIVTPYAFRVADRLMGEPLATPWRRAAAMLVDLLAILGIVVVREIAGPLFLLLLAWFAYRATTHRARNPVRGRAGRLALRSVAVLLLLVSVGQGIEVVTEGIDSPGEGAGGGTDAPGPVLEESAASQGAHIGLTDLPGLVRGISDLRSDDTARGRADSLARAWVASLEAGDTARADSARESLVRVLAADTVAPLRRQVSALSATLRRMEDRIEEAEDPPGILEYLRGIARDLGFGFGSLGLYFTAFLALWDGYTPGKRLLGIRVARVNGEPLGWWDAFSRFGGYAASFVTGLVGFLQIFWDANRQGLHDRIAGTVVLRERGGQHGDEEDDR